MIIRSAVRWRLCGGDGWALAPLAGDWFETAGLRRREGYDILSKSSDAEAVRENMKVKKKPPATDLGDALKSAYQRTLDEDIPPEMLDLLGKLD